MFMMMNTKKLKLYNESNGKAHRSMKFKNGITMCKCPKPYYKKKIYMLSSLMSLYVREFHFKFLLQLIFEWSTWSFHDFNLCKFAI